MLREMSWRPVIPQADHPPHAKHFSRVSPQNPIGPTARDGLTPPEKQRVDEPRKTTLAARAAEPDGSFVVMPVRANPIAINDVNETTPPVCMDPKPVGFGAFLATFGLTTRETTQLIRVAGTNETVRYYGRVSPLRGLAPENHPNLSRNPY